ncbi:hypothetical protein ACWCP6_03985 [Streptomyces sp. NPDC002004]
MSVRLRDLVRRREGSAVGAGTRSDVAGRVSGELAADLPDEDLGECLDDCLDLYEMGSKPRCEEVEYLQLVQDAIDEIATEG